MALNLVGTSGNATIDADTGISGFTIDFDVWTTATRPASPSTGDTGFNSDLNCLETYNGSAWVSQLPSQTGNNGKYLTTNGTSPSWATVAGGPEWQSVQTGNFNATAGNAYPINTTSAAITVTLPASPTAGQQIILTDYAGTWVTNNVTVNPNGNKIIGYTANGTLSTNYATCSLVYVDSTKGWISYSNISPTFGPGTVEYLVVAGGGGGGGPSSSGGVGGGGAGGLLTGSVAVTVSSTYTITVGAGGATQNNGSNSSALSLTAIGGGRGGTAAGVAGASGGSGGGGAESSGAAGTATSGQGNNGGNGNSSGDSGAGGGGAGAVGGNAASSVGGNGGNGTASSITGSSVTYAGGGGGSVYYGSSGSGGNGGTGGGGNGATSARSQTATSGTANTGGGGGGYGVSQTGGGAGGSGIVVIRYSDSYAAAASTTGSPTYTVSGGYRIYTWTSSGSITF